METLFEQQGLQKYRGRQLMKWVYHQGRTDFAAMTDLPKSMREWLQQNTCFDLPQVETFKESKDGTCKWALNVGGNNFVESVVIPDKGRNTLCISSQIGCILDCSFCSTGKQGFSGNLSSASIVGQLILANRKLADRGERVTNIVFMGMGEPLLNFDAAVTASNIMMEDLAFGLSKRRVTISTAGVVPAIYKLAQVTDVSLAISLHAPTDELRDQLVPLNRKYPIKELLAACREYVDKLGKQRKLVIEYTLIAGINDQHEHAVALANLLRDVRCKINLIPFNPFPASGYERSAKKDIWNFQTYLMKQGYATMLRTTRGADIDAACGQLVGQVQDRTKRKTRYLARVKSADEQSANISQDSLYEMVSNT
ncbi:MAG: 23S rRNA (adenine(2503)-C(2))-methyltransferase RlmN [Gammaproteobacteria bacterium]|nr:23S rRNA (adenine(2503)-C(2))-methyltransferase RlmN [Gammaproteobacteria bacterium]